MYILGVVLRTDVEMRVHNNSNLQKNNVAIMGMNVSCSLDDHVFKASGSTKLRSSKWWQSIG